jgi:hypothetical protein
MPEPDKLVLICSTKPYDPVTTACYCRTMVKMSPFTHEPVNVEACWFLGFEVCGTWEGSFDMGEVTHWMPLPEPPKE